MSYFIPSLTSFPVPVCKGRTTLSIKDEWHVETKERAPFSLVWTGERLSIVQRKKQPEMTVCILCSSWFGHAVLLVAQFLFKGVTRRFEYRNGPRKVLRSRYLPFPIRLSFLVSSFIRIFLKPMINSSSCEMIGVSIVY